jgi:hypothetical protein
MLLWCRLRQQRRRHKIIEKQWQMTFRSGFSTTDEGGCVRTTPQNGVDGTACGSSCGGRPTAVVRAVDQRCSETACGQQPVVDASCSANGSVSSIDTLTGASRTCNGNLYEKLDYATSGRPKAAVLPRANVEPDYRESVLPPAPPPPARALPSCCDTAVAADATCCSATECDVEGWYEDIDEYLKPMMEQGEQIPPDVDC